MDRVVRQAMIMAAMTSADDIKNGAPGKVCQLAAGPLIDAANSWVNRVGPIKLARPVRLASAPCSRPCSVGDTNPVMTACKEGVAMPHNAMMGIANQKTVPEVASP